MDKDKTKHSARTKDISTLIYTILVIIVANVISWYFFFRIDLTNEKRYTLSENTKEILRNLDEPIFLKIYLEGGLNIPFKKFQTAIKEHLDEFRVYAKNNLQYEFIDPLEDADQKLREKILEELYGKGLKPTNIHHRDRDGSVTEKIIIPGAILYYKNIEVPVNFLLNNPGKSGEENLIASQSTLEYTLIGTIKDISNPNVEKIAFLEGHGEFSDPEVGDFMKALSTSFQIDRGSLSGNIGELDDYKLLVIAGPVKPFSESDKLIIDQYVMNGGKVMWLIDAVVVDFDSLAIGSSLALQNNLNLDDLFFRYGFRINAELVQDIQCNVLPVNVALAGNTPNFQPAPWLYYPLISPNRNHLISSNTNMVWCRFASPIDTIGARDKLKKTVLLQTSEFSREKPVPALVSLQEIRETPKQEDFTESNQIVGILLEGEFESAFKNRMIEQLITTGDYRKIDNSPDNKMIVIADADIIRNDVRETAKGPLVSPLGYDRFTRQSFGNKDFLINAAQYLTDDSNLLTLRGREFKLRLLDRNKISEDRLRWQIINMALPILLIILLGIVYQYLRLKKYSR